MSVSYHIRKVQTFTVHGMAVSYHIRKVETFTVHGMAVSYHIRKVAILGRSRHDGLFRSERIRSKWMAGGMEVQM